MKPIYISHQHEIIIETYLDTIYDSINDIVKDSSKYNDFLDICKVIIDYHNSYSEGQTQGNFSDFLLIIPINFSTMVSGFLCGLETKDIASMVKIHRVVLYELGLRVISDLRKLKLIHE